MLYGKQYLVYGGCSYTTYQIMEICHLGEFDSFKVDPAFWQEKICETVSRNLTKVEWSKYVGMDIKYQAICDDLPVPAE